MLFAAYNKNQEMASNTLHSLVSTPMYGREGQGVVYSRHFTDVDGFIRESERALFIGDASIAGDPTDSVYQGETVF